MAFLTVAYFVGLYLFDCLWIGYVISAYPYTTPLSGPSAWPLTPLPTYGKNSAFQVIQNLLSEYVFSEF